MMNEFEKKIWIEANDVDELLRNMDRLKQTDPEERITIILSKGYYYIEGAASFIRSWEELIYAGKVKNYKHKPESK